MEREIRIRQATIEDLEDVSELFDEYRIFYGQKSDLEGAREFLFQRFEHRESVLFLAQEEDTGDAVGFAQLYPSFSSVSMKRLWILNDLFIRSDYRNRQIGRRMLEKARAFAAATGSKGLEIATQVTNFKAQRVYEAHGYKKDDGYIHYYLTL